MRINPSLRVALLSCASLVALAPVVGQRAQAGPLEEAYQHLDNVMDRYHATFDVHTDISAAGNHFVYLGKMPDETASVEMDLCCAQEPHSGSTCIRCAFSPARSWGGFYFLNGLLKCGDVQPSENWGEVCQAGFDLREATRLTFWARGERGGEKIEFFCGGVGRNPFTGLPEKPCPDSFPRTPRWPTTFALSQRWQQFTVDLSGKDLRYVIGGFGWVASRDLNPSGAVFYLDDIQYNKARLSEPRFLVGYETVASEDDFDVVLKNAAFTYDNALAALAYMARRSGSDMTRARLIMEALLYSLQHDRFYADGRLRNAYQGGDLVLFPGWLAGIFPNCYLGTARMPGWWDCATGHWYEDGAQVGSYAGNMAWAIIALVRFWELSREDKFLQGAALLADWVESTCRDESGFGGYLGGFERWEPTPGRVRWKSTEHNIDLHVAFSRLCHATGDARYCERAAHAKAFVESMWDPDLGCFLTGTKPSDSGEQRNSSVIPLDVQAWAVLADLQGDRPCISCAQQRHGCSQDGFSGFDFNTDRDGIWFEGTAHMVLAYQEKGDLSQANVYLTELIRAQASSCHANGHGLVAASHDGVTTGFDNIDGSPWLLYCRQHVGTTAWFIFALQHHNPFWNTDTLKGRFDDVPKTLYIWRYVEAIATAGITGGCSAAPPLYCPAANVSRAQMAAFLCKAAGKEPLNRDAPTFADVPKTHWAYGYVERLADPASWGGNPPTSGCRVVAATRYFCPSDSVTRGQVAKFLCVARGKTWLETATPTFADVPKTHPFYGWIERLADAASWGAMPPTSGCTPTTFCPSVSVTRGQMAKFIVLAFGLPY
jgi:hypothetical protein